MSDLYSELLVTRKSSALAGVVRVLLVTLTAVAVILALLTFSLVFLIAAVALGVADYFLIPRLNLEFEYLLVNDELDVDKIFSKSKRKKAMTIDLKKAEVLAPLGSHRLDSYQNLKNVDFSANDKEKRPYALVTSNDKEMVKILLQLDSNMFQTIKRRFPRVAFDD